MMRREENNVTLPARLPTRRQIIAGAAMIFSGVTLGATKALAADEEIAHNAESIHQEHTFKASRKRVYEALLDTKQFHSVMLLSAAMKSGMAPGMKPTDISREAGGAFTIFGGYITGRQIELLPNERIVQAWRTGIWDPGIYSIARFELTEQGTQTKLSFDHTGFPKGEAEHLAAGWKSNYWEPLEKFLAQA
jgi:activator of HSP90 ATPase